MKYRKFNKIDVEISPIGFGCMRFPVSDKADESTIVKEEATKMLRHAIDNGLNYVDTAWMYHNFKSEDFVGEALQDGYREKVNLATKLPIWLVESEDDVIKYLDIQLGKLKTDHVDFYLVHALDKERWEIVKKHNVLAKLKEAQAMGKVKYLGFSFHDDYDTFQMIIDSFDWDFYQIQFNYINTDYQAGMKGLKYAGEKGISAVIMEPLLGGKLANLTPQVEERISKERSQVEWALDFLWSQPEIAVVLSGMSTMEQVEQNLEFAGRWEENQLKEEDYEMLRYVKEIFDRMALVPCTKCGYCMPCPFGLNIPGLFEAYNQTASVSTSFAKKTYASHEVKADACKECHRCEKECPQHIKISEVLKKVAETLGE